MKVIMKAFKNFLYFLFGFCLSVYFVCISYASTVQDDADFPDVAQYYAQVVSDIAVNFPSGSACVQYNSGYVCSKVIVAPEFYNKISLCPGGPTFTLPSGCSIISTRLNRECNIAIIAYFTNNNTTIAGDSIPNVMTAKINDITQVGPVIDAAQNFSLSLAREKGCPEGLNETGYITSYAANVTQNANDIDVGILSHTTLACSTNTYTSYSSIQHTIPSVSGSTMPQQVIDDIHDIKTILSSNNTNNDIASIKNSISDFVNSTYTQQPTNDSPDDNSYLSIPSNFVHTDENYSILNTYINSVKSHLPILSGSSFIHLAGSSSSICFNSSLGQKCYDFSVHEDYLNLIGSVLIGLCSILYFYIVLRG